MLCAKSQVPSFACGYLVFPKASFVDKTALSSLNGLDTLVKNILRMVVGCVTQLAVLVIGLYVCLYSTSLSRFLSLCHSFLSLFWPLHVPCGILVR